MTTERLPCLQSEPCLAQCRAPAARLPQTLLLASFLGSQQVVEQGSKAVTGTSTPKAQCVQARVAWHKLLTAHLDGVTKLVGPVVSCEGTPFKGNAASTWKTNPHVQSYTIAMDRVRSTPALHDVHKAWPKHTHMS